MHMFCVETVAHKRAKPHVIVVLHQLDVTDDGDSATHFVIDVLFIKGRMKIFCQVGVKGAL